MLNEYKPRNQAVPNWEHPLEKALALEVKSWAENEEENLTEEEVDSMVEMLIYDEPLWEQFFYSCKHAKDQLPRRPYGKEA
jgi:hypothetical protein